MTTVTLLTASMRPRRDREILGAQPTLGPPPTPEVGPGLGRKGTLPSNQPPPGEHESNVTDVQTSFYMLLTKFRKFPKTETPNTENVEQFLRKALGNEADEHLANVCKRGDSDRSFLHVLVKAPEYFEGRLPLLQWAMEKHPKLYLEGVDDDNSILHLAAKKCKASTKKEYISTLVKLYPVQTANILRQTKDQEKLLGDIIPFIRTIAGPEFLNFFGKTSETPELKPCLCPQCGDQIAEDGVTAVGGIGEQAQASSTSCTGNISRDEIGDAVVLRWKKPSDDGLSPTHGNAKALATKAPSQELGKHSSAEVATPLHLAATYHDCDHTGREMQFSLVKQLFFWQPGAIQKMDAEGRSPYLHRAAGCEKRRPATDDTVAFFLKDQIMHLDDRDLVLDLLYGKSQGMPRQTSTSLAKRDERDIRQEREIDLDLRELQMSAPSSAKKEDLLEFIDKLEFEDILQYVQIPRHPFRPRGAPRVPADAVEAKPDKKGAGRRDFESIFELLHKKGVKKILRLIVDDDDSCLHQDDVTERLKRFDEIEDFQWRKMDMSSMVLRHGVPRVRTLHLFSSGNHSVLRDWSSSDGLCNLVLLETVFLRIYWKTEPQQRMEQYANDFINRMIKNCPQIRTVDVRLEPLTYKNHEEWQVPNSLVTTNKWLQTMQKFASLIGNVIKDREAAISSNQAASASTQGDHRVRVAILDDGIDWAYAKEIGCTGMSFYADRRQDFKGQKAWYSSSTDHGTLMAALVRKICPDVNLYVARLDQTETEGVFQPTAESAVKAIKWAMMKDVHVISMSWTIPGEHRALEQAVDEAHKAGILMFGAASDQGANSTSNPYMARLSNEGKGPVICIGGAREAGYGDEKALSEAEFFFPGQTHGIPEPLPHLKSNFGGRIGSSVATALATGLTALIMLLVNISPKYGGSAPTKPGTAGTGGGGRSGNITSLPPAPSYRSQLQSPSNIRKVFRDLLIQPEPNNLRPASRNDSIIKVGRFFQHGKLRKELEPFMGLERAERAERSRGLLDEMVLQRIMRSLVDDTKETWEESAGDSDQDDD